MPRKVKVVNIHDDSTYGDITEAVVENEKAENETNEVNRTEQVGEPEPQPKEAKAMAKRVSKPKTPLQRTDTVVDADTALELETANPAFETKPKPKRAAKVKTVEPPLVVDPPPEKPNAVRKPRVKKEPKEELKIVVPAFPPRRSRTKKREALCHGDIQRLSVLNDM